MGSDEENTAVGEKLWRTGEEEARYFRIFSPEEFELIVIGDYVCWCL